jgi:hypothetical protein
LEKPPSLFCEHGQIERMKISKSQTSIFHWFCQLLLLTQCALFSLSIWLHQYLLIIVLNSSHTDLVRSKHAIEYTRIACATAFIIPPSPL